VLALRDDPRVDPRIKAVLGDLTTQALGDVASREELLAEANTPEALATRAAVERMLDSFDDETVVPSVGLGVSTIDVVSSPNGNTIRLQVVRPHSNTPLPCVYYIHGGGMANGSSYLGMYRAWGRLIANQGVVVVMVDFRNSVSPSSIPDVSPYPGGLNDCISGLEWVASHASEIGVDPTHVVVGGESGGGNLALATGMKLLREGRQDLVQGIYAMCPSIAGLWPQQRFPSSSQNNGLLLDLRDNRMRVSYGIESFEARDPLAWPAFATEDDVRGLVPTVISVNDCDPLRDEGIEFYYLLVRAGVRARCRNLIGTTHGLEIFTTICPEISTDTAVSIAKFAASA
jgi:acetyl esterase/lipase